MQLLLLGTGAQHAEPPATVGAPSPRPALAWRPWTRARPAAPTTCCWPSGAPVGAALVAVTVAGARADVPAERAEHRGEREICAAAFVQGIIDAAQAGEPDRYLAALLAPERGAPGAAGAGRIRCRDRAHPVWLVREPAMGDIRLQWWRDALEPPPMPAPARIRGRCSARRRKERCAACHSAPCHDRRARHATRHARLLRRRRVLANSCGKPRARSLPLAALVLGSCRRHVRPRGKGRR